MIIVYTGKNCIYCHKVKDLLKKRDKEFEERDIEQYRNELVEKTGQLGVPVTDIDGEIVVGFSKNRLENLL